MYDIFSLKDFKFPDGFLWGSAAAGHQIEGNNIYSDRWAIEAKNVAAGKPFYEASGMACNHYNMVEEDTKLLKTLGHKVFRNSVEWCRIEPSEGHFDMKEVDHYLYELSLLKENGIKFMCSVVHGSMPKWFADMGGFGKEENLKYFERYLKFIIPKIAPYVDYWTVLNEFTNFAADSMINFNSMLFHALGYHTIKQYSDKPVSSAHAFIESYPKRRYDKLDNAMADVVDWRQNEFFFHAMRTGEMIYPGIKCRYDNDVKNTADYWAVNIYTRQFVDSRRESDKPYDFNRIDFLEQNNGKPSIDPETLINCTARLHDKPIFITENGCEAPRHFDDFKIVYIALYLSALRECINQGADIMGYLHWSLLDNYEWFSYYPKYGLVEVDLKTFERKIRPSGLFYRDIIENNGLNQEIIRKYLSEMPTKMKPNRI